MTDVQEVETTGIVEKKMETGGSILRLDWQLPVVEKPSCHTA